MVPILATFPVDINDLSPSLDLDEAYGSGLLKTKSRRTYSIPP